MKHQQTIDGRAVFTETGDDLRSIAHGDVAWLSQGEHAMPIWADAPPEKCGNGTLALDDRRRDRERIACLECVVAILIEKNEHMRQQLQMYID